MDVVRIVAEAHEPLVVGGADIGFVLPRGVDVDADRILPAAEPVIDVRRHVDHVPGVARQAGGEAIGGGLGALGVGAILHQMDVEMRRLRMGGVARHDPLDQRDRFAEARLGGLLVGLPIIPRQRVHRRFRREHGDIVMRGIIAGDGQHGVGISAVERRRGRRRAGRNSALTSAMISARSAG